MADAENDMTLVIIAVNGKDLQSANLNDLGLRHPQLKRTTEMGAVVMPMRDALRKAMDKQNHDLGGLLMEMRDFIWRARGYADEVPHG